MSPPRPGATGASSTASSYFYPTDNSVDNQSSIEDPPTQVEKKAKEANAGAQPLAPPPPPPPRPAPGQQAEQVDYFSGTHSNNHLAREPNPFEKSFGQPSAETSDSKSLLPPVAALTSPAPLAPEGASAGGYNFSSSLRSGPLSPAMLGGPVGSGTDYFGPQPSTGFPGVTPNESSLRTGLTPGGGGSMFPAPSPNSQAFIQSLANGGATPSTLDFHRTAITAAAASKQKQYTNNITTTQDTKNIPASSMDPALQQQSAQQSTFGQHDNDAANGLFLLAQATNGQQANPYANTNVNSASTNLNRSLETSPTMANTARQNGSLTGSVQGSGDVSDSGDQGKMATRSRGKKTSAGKGAAAANARRKAEDAPPKQPSTKKQKNGNTVQMMDDDDSDEEPQPDIKEEQYDRDGRKMTDEEKRKNFLERNRYGRSGLTRTKNHLLTGS